MANMNSFSGEVVTDTEMMGEKTGLSHEERMHWGELSEDELVTQKKLQKKIDLLIMPCVISVYLMNYIDR